jgi:hypothetical protein
VSAPAAGARIQAVFVTLTRRSRPSSKGIVRAFAAALLLGPLVATAASAAELHPELTLEGRYDDNIRTSDPREDDFVRAVAPGLTATTSWPLADWSAWGRRTLRWYSSETGLPKATTDAATVKATHAGRPVDLRLRADYRRTKDDWEATDQSVFVPGEYHSGYGTGDLIMRRFETDARIAAYDYSVPEQSDATTQQGGLSFFPVRGTAQDWVVSYRGRRLNVNGRRSLTSQAALAGFRRRNTSRIGTRLEGGVTRVNYEEGDGWVTLGAFTAGLTIYAPGKDHPVASFLVERDAATTFLAEAGRHFGGVLLSASWRRRLDAVGGYTAHPMIEQRAAVTLSDSIGAHMTVSVEGSYGWTRAFRGPESGADAWRAGIFWTVPIATGVSSTLSYDFLSQEDRDRPVPVDFDRNRIILSLTGEIP